jgi:hypothetical protein
MLFTFSKNSMRFYDNKGQDGPASSACTLALLVSFIFQIVSLSIPNWFVLNGTHASVRVGLLNAKCESQKGVGCRQSVLFQRSPPEPPSADKDSWYADYNLREFWEGALEHGRPKEDVTTMTEAHRQQVPRWDSVLARKQLAAIQLLASGMNFKAATSLLSLAVVFMWIFPPLSLALTVGALVAWSPVPSTLAPAFGDYNGSHGACLYLTAITAVLLGGVTAYMCECERCFECKRTERSNETVTETLPTVTQPTVTQPTQWNETVTQPTQWNPVASEETEQIASKTIPAITPVST